MKTTILISLSPDEMQEYIKEAVMQAVMQIENRTNQSVLSVTDIAKDAGFSTDTVRSWILSGRVGPGGKRIKLKIMNGLAETYRVRWEAYREFLAAFPDIACPKKR